MTLDYAGEPSTPVRVLVWERKAEDQKGGSTGKTGTCISPLVHARWLRCCFTCFITEHLKPAKWRRWPSERPGPQPSPSAAASSGRGSSGYFSLCCRLGVLRRKLPGTALLLRTPSCTANTESLSINANSFQPPQNSHELPDAHVISKLSFCRRFFHQLPRENPTLHAGACPSGPFGYKVPSPRPCLPVTSVC